MMRLQTYAGLSFVATLVVIYHAFHTRAQFYPATVHLSTSKISLVLLLNMGLVIMCAMWQITKRIFLGSLREAEVERLNEQSWREVMEILFAITIFRQDFSVMFLAMVTALLLIKALHWLAQKRVEYIETTPSVPKMSHIRIVSFMGFLFLLDSFFLYSSVKYLVQTRRASVSLFFAFEYMILATTTVSTFVKYVFYVSDMLMEGQWERKAVYTFYLELIRDLLHLSMYLCFFLAIFVNYGVPLHLIRELYETFRNFKVRIADYIRYRKITSNMNDRFPDATPEELNASDATCIICREEMTTAKRLNCGHLFHVHCLRSWLERQHTCPTCRALVAPPENGTNSSGPHADAQQQGVTNVIGRVSLNEGFCVTYKRFGCALKFCQYEGIYRIDELLMIVIDADTRNHLLETEDLEDEDFFEIIRKLPDFLNSKDNQESPRTGAVSTPSQPATGDGIANDSISQHQARLKAAAAAASIYERSFVYPSANTLVWTPGYAVLPEAYRRDTTNTDSGGEEQSLAGPSQQHPFAIPGGPANLFPHSGFFPFSAPGINVNCGEGFGSNLNASDSQVDAREKDILNQIEILQGQLHYLTKSAGEKSMDASATASSDSKGKTVATSSSSSSSCVSDCGPQGETKETEKR
ncbi:hypothetical protein RHSIM_Rhsim09G0212400 [Rhododendron simsii]|uniref:RING-type E3 ubiquitin transferase n=1 Tax=Rhododendron simsii TaxID=118357 RepID=A0A834LEN7_RHOSS|nr:hypothetical protein RHSIM_Rhsim09G0212400 [Rhododendron simsii]